MCVRHRLMTSQPFHRKPKGINALPHSKTHPTSILSACKTVCKMWLPCTPHGHLPASVYIIRRISRWLAVPKFVTRCYSLERSLALSAGPTRIQFGNKRRIGAKSWPEKKNSSENKKFAHPSITESAVSQTLAISQFTLSSTLDFALVRPPWAADMLKPPLRWHQSAFITLDVSYEKEKSSSRHSSVIGRSVQHWHPHQTPRPSGRPFLLSCTCFLFLPPLALEIRRPAIEVPPCEMRFT